MSSSSLVILESPLVVPELSDIYNRVLQVIPDPLELMHIALLEAQWLADSQGTTTTELLNRYMEALNADVIQEYSDLINVPIESIRVKIADDLQEFINRVSKYYRGQFFFKGFTKYLLENKSYVMVDSLIESPPQLIAKIKVLNYVQISKRDYTDGLSLKDDLPDVP